MADKRSRDPHRAQVLALEAGETSLGIELGSTRIKACLIGPGQEVLALGGHDWENQLVDGVWTYSLSAVWDGLRACVASLLGDAERRFGCRPTTFGSVGISAMMHGYLAFDQEDRQLVPFRTWRNTSAGGAAAELTEALDFHFPVRWSASHLYQAVLDDEPHVRRIAFVTTLAGYVHWALTGRRVLGVGDASGMFPIDPSTGDFDQDRLGRFQRLVTARQPALDVASVLPTVLMAGEPAGTLTSAGALLLDPDGSLRAGAPFCPPEGDAGTGMVATNAVAPRTGNISAGTSIFAMVVLERPLAAVHAELDLVTTPAGELVAMVHCNNGASELDSWAGVFTELARALGWDGHADAVFEALFRAALDGEPDGGGLLAYNYLSGEPLAGLDEGRPLILRTPQSRLTLGNLMRTQIYSAFATLALGMGVLEDEGVALDSMFAHGGLFRTPGVAQRLLAAAIAAPVAVGDTAGEGGAWGMAVLADFARTRESGSADLAEFLRTCVFADSAVDVADPDPNDMAGFSRFLDRHRAGLEVEHSAVRHLQ